MVHSDSRARVDQVVLAERSRVRRDSAAAGEHVVVSRFYTGTRRPGESGTGGSKQQTRRSSEMIPRRCAASSILVQ